MAYHPGVNENVIAQIENELLRYCGPIFVTPSPNSYPDNKTIKNGTYALIDTGQKRLLVTCYHVWEYYETQFDVNPETVLALALNEGEPCIAFRNPKERRLAFDRELDLAVFEFAPDFCHSKSWFRMTEHPAPKVEKGECIVTMGFPGICRTVSGTVCNFNGVAMPLVVTDISDRTIAAFSDKENQSVLSDMKDSLAGISGSPAYRLADNGQLQLVGFAKQGPLESDSPHRTYEPALESPLPAVFFTHASFLMQDGKLHRHF